MNFQTRALVNCLTLLSPLLSRQTYSFSVPSVQITSVHQVIQPRNAFLNNTPRSSSITHQRIPSDLPMTPAGTDLNFLSSASMHVASSAFLITEQSTLSKLWSIIHFLYDIIAGTTAIGVLNNVVLAEHVKLIEGVKDDDTKVEFAKLPQLDEFDEMSSSVFPDSEAFEGDISPQQSRPFVVVPMPVHVKPTMFEYRSPIHVHVQSVENSLRSSRFLGMETNNTDPNENEFIESTVNSKYDESFNQNETKNIRIGGYEEEEVTKENSELATSKSILPIESSSKITPPTFLTIPDTEPDERNIPTCKKYIAPESNSKILPPAFLTLPDDESALVQPSKFAKNEPGFVDSESRNTKQPPFFLTIPDDKSMILRGREYETNKFDDSESQLIRLPPTFLTIPDSGSIILNARRKYESNELVATEKSGDHSHCGNEFQHSESLGIRKPYSFQVVSDTQHDQDLDSLAENNSDFDEMQEVSHLELSSTDVGSSSDFVENYLFHDTRRKVTKTHTNDTNTKSTDSIKKTKSVLVVKNRVSDQCKFLV